MRIEVDRQNSIYEWGKMDIHFNKVMEQLDCITLLIPAKYRNDLFIKPYFHDAWLYFYAPNIAIENPERAMIYQVRKIFFQSLSSAPTIQRVLALTEGDVECSYVVATFVVKEMFDWLAEMDKVDDDLIENCNIVSEYANVNITKFFDKQFQSIEPYPKELAYSQATLVKKIWSYFNANELQIAERLKKATDEAILLHKDIKK